MKLVHRSPRDTNGFVSGVKKRSNMSAKGGKG